MNKLKLVHRDCHERFGHRIMIGSLSINSDQTYTLDIDASQIDIASLHEKIRQLFAAAPAKEYLTL